MSVRVSECQQTQHQQHVPRRFASYSVFQSLLPPTLLNKYSFSYSYIPPKPNQNPFTFAFLRLLYLLLFRENMIITIIIMSHTLIHASTITYTYQFTTPPSLSHQCSATASLVLLLSSYVPPLIYSLFLFSIRMEKKKFLIFNN